VSELKVDKGALQSVVRVNTSLKALAISFSLNAYPAFNIQALLRHSVGQPVGREELVETLTVRRGALSTSSEPNLKYQLNQMRRRRKSTLMQRPPLGQPRPHHLSEPFRSYSY
jgi:hypothetical protein